MNDDEVVILRGLKEDDRVLLAPPVEAEKMKIARLTGPSLKPKTLTGDSARATTLQGGPPTQPPPTRHQGRVVDAASGAGGGQARFRPPKKP